MAGGIFYFCKPFGKNEIIFEFVIGNEFWRIIHCRQGKSKDASARFQCTHSGFEANTGCHVALTIWTTG